LPLGASPNISVIRATSVQLVCQEVKFLNDFNVSKEGEDQPRSGRPLTAQTDENVAKIHEIIMEDR